MDRGNRREQGTVLRGNRGRFSVPDFGTENRPLLPYIHGIPPIFMFWIDLYQIFPIRRIVIGAGSQNVSPCYLLATPAHFP